MVIKIKNKNILIYKSFAFRCCMGAKGITKNKNEGDGKTPKGKFNLGYLYYRADRNIKPSTKMKCIKINKSMGWCNDINNKNYNRLIKINNKIRYEKMYRRDHKYDFVLNVKYNYTNVTPGKGSAIFIHLTKNYKPTAGCIALKKLDMLILLKLIDKNTKISIN